jgi:hypothetical protein
MKLTILFLFLSITILPQAFITFPEDTIALNERWNNRQFAAYDSQGKIHLAYSSQLGTNNNTGEIFYSKEESNGSFTTVQLTNNSVSDNYPTLSIDANDKIHIGYTGRDASNLFQIRYLHNVNGSFGTPIEITAGGLNKATPFSKIGPDSVMHFVYYTYVDGVDNFYYRNYDLRTSSLSPELLLSQGEAGGDFEATLDIDQNGKVHIVGRAGTNLFSGPIKYFNNVSGSFQEIATGVAVNLNLPRISIDKNNNVHITYRASNTIFYLNNTSGSFSTPVAISPTGQLPAGYQNFAIDDNNNIYFIWQSSQTASGRGYYLKMLYGTTFTDTMRVDELPSTYITRNSSMVIAKGNGDIALFYAPGIMRNSEVACDIFMKRGNIWTIVPVELISFNAFVENNSVNLSWVTATETNNSGFELFRRKDDEQWKLITFISGTGTATEPSAYSYKDENLQAGLYKYKLTQIDFDGTRNELKEIEVEIENLPLQFALLQNYPNPFNPATAIKFSLPEAGFVTLKVYDILGKEVKSLISGNMEKGAHEIIFDSEDLSSGVYVYKLTAAGYSSAKKMLLSK